MQGYNNAHTTQPAKQMLHNILGKVMKVIIISTYNDMEGKNDITVININ